ncbi:hypothetical protein LAZ67_X004222 [Cordylochernes scorpioides]|uniref:Uncharacterized protein n=1 Tax=Cordylochernes scorpioides TaxID=51811 RepID=A0ABY6LUT5_9ARAC|nr:hypothetical protein LAZ67_X004222 [Cordylochernes scorpioides]
MWIREVLVIASKVLLLRKEEFIPLSGYISTRLSSHLGGEWNIMAANYSITNENVHHGKLEEWEYLQFSPTKTCIKFCVKNEIKCADAFRMLTVAYGEATLDRSNVYPLYKMFSEG